MYIRLPYIIAAHIGARAGYMHRSLRDDAFDEKHAALHCVLPDRLDRLIGWRIIPGTRLLNAVESDHYNALWRFAIEALSLSASNHEVVVAVERRQRSRDLLSIFLYGNEVRYCVSFRDEVGGGRLDLLSMNHSTAGPADRNASQHCQHEFVVRFHRLILPMCLRERTAVVRDTSLASQEEGGRVL